MKLTKRTVDALRYEGSGAEMRVSDSELRGFAVVAYPSGRKRYVVRFRTSDGRRRQVAIGYHGEVTAEQARRQAAVLLGQVAGGRDPAAEREEKPRGTVRELAEVYLERHAKPRKKTWRADENRIARHVLPTLGKLPAASVRRSDIELLHHEIGVKQGLPYEANRVRALLSVMFRRAVDWGFMPEGHQNPCAGIARYREQPRDRYVMPEEMGRLLAAISAEPDPFLRAYFQLLLLLGLRKSELLRARWADVDFEHRVLRIPEPKSGKPQSVPLPAAAVEILTQLPHTVGNQHVFASPRFHGACREGVRKPWERICREAGIEGLTLHDLRRSLGAWAIADGESLRVVQGALRHSSAAVTARHYSPMEQDTTLRAAFERHAERLKVAGGGRDDG